MAGTRFKQQLDNAFYPSGRLFGLAGRRAKSMHDRMSPEHRDDIPRARLKARAHMRDAAQAELRHKPRHVARAIAYWKAYPPDELYQDFVDRYPDDAERFDAMCRTNGFTEADVRQLQRTTCRHAIQAQLVATIWILYVAYTLNFPDMPIGPALVGGSVAAVMFAAWFVKEAHLNAQARRRELIGYARWLREDLPTLNFKWVPDGLSRRAVRDLTIEPV